MWERRPFAGFVVRLLMIYGVLCIPWPGIRQGFAALYRYAANGFFGSFGSDGVAHFQSAPTRPNNFDSQIQLLKRDTPKLGTARHDSIRTGYFPIAETIALVLATPIPWQRRWKALLFGILLANGFVALRVYIILIYLFSVERPWALYKPSPFWNEVLTRVYDFIAIFPVAPFLVPVLIWILVSFNGEDVRRFVDSTEKKAPT